MLRQLLSSFLIFLLLPFSQLQADQLVLPVPGTMVPLSPVYVPPMLKGIKVHPENPFKFEFILDQGSGNHRQPGDIVPVGATATPGSMSPGTLPSALAMKSKAPEGTNQSHRSNPQTQAQLKEESTKLIKYFLASLTTPEKDLWVNLSPYEKDRIVPDSFGQTEMGRDLLAQDYILKQITASLIYPEDAIGKKFWQRIYEEAAKRFGTTQVPVNTFNKVWIVPEKAVVYENAKAGTAYVVESSLKVMLEEDYLAINKNRSQPGDMMLSPQVEAACPQAGCQTSERLSVKASQGNNRSQTVASQIVREVVLPQLTKEINEGQNFAQLRQVYNSLILATWYKKKIKDSILNQVYADKNKIKGTEYKTSIIQPMPTRGHDVAPKGSVIVSSSTMPNELVMNSKATQRNQPNAIESPSRLPNEPTNDFESTPGKSHNDVELIYTRYLQAFKKGAYNYIKDEEDPLTKTTTPKKYFSGGVNFFNASPAMTTVTNLPAQRTDEYVLRVDMAMSSSQGMWGDKRSIYYLPQQIVAAVGSIKKIIRMIGFTDEEKVVNEYFNEAMNEALVKRGEVVVDGVSLFIKDLFEYLSTIPNEDRANTQVVFLKSGADPLFEMARLYARVTGSFPDSNLKTVWATMTQYFTMVDDEQQRILFTKYLYDQGVLQPGIKRVLIVDTDTGYRDSRFQSRKGTEQIFGITILDNAIIDRVNGLFGLRIPYFNSGPGSAAFGMRFMSLGYSQAEFSDKIFRQRFVSSNFPNVEIYNRLNISGFRFQDPLELWSYVDKAVKLVNVSDRFVLTTDQRVSLPQVPVYPIPLDETGKEELLHAFQQEGLNLGQLEQILFNNNDQRISEKVQQEIDQLLDRLQRQVAIFLRHKQFVDPGKQRNDAAMAGDNGFVLIKNAISSEEIFQTMKFVETLNALRGQRIAVTDGSGRITFSKGQKRLVFWAVLGLEQRAWDVISLGAKPMNEKKAEVAVLLMNGQGEYRIRLFEIGDVHVPWEGRKYYTFEPRRFQDKDNTLLAYQEYFNQSDFLLHSNNQGKLSIVLSNGINGSGKYAADFKELNSKRAYRLKVRREKGGDFKIYLEELKDLDRGAPGQLTGKIIEGDLGQRMVNDPVKVLRDLIKRQESFDINKANDAINSIQGEDIGRTGKDGLLWVSLGEGQSYGWPVLGYQEQGWRARILGSRINDTGDALLVSVVLSQQDGYHIIRVFEFAKEWRSKNRGKQFYLMVPKIYENFENIFEETQKYLQQMPRLRPDKFGNVVIVFADGKLRSKGYVKVYQNGEYFQVFGTKEIPVQHHVKHVVFEDKLTDSDDAAMSGSSKSTDTILNIGKILAAPDEFNRNVKEIMPLLEGGDLGGFTTSGMVLIKVANGFYYHCPIWGKIKYQEGLRAYVKQVFMTRGVMNIIVGYRVNHPVHGQRDLLTERAFQISPVVRTVVSKNKDRQVKMPVLAIDDRLGAVVMADIVDVKKFESYRRNKFSLKGIRFNEISGGAFSVGSYKTHHMLLPILGFKGDGWKAEIIRDRFFPKTGYYEFTTRATKPFEESIVRTFELGRFKETVLIDGQSREFYIIVPKEDVPHRYIRHVLFDTKEPFDPRGIVQTLNGLRGGVIRKDSRTVNPDYVSKTGEIDFVQEGSRPYSWPILGFADEGWRATIQGARVNENGLPEMAVGLQKDGMPYRIRVFEISAQTFEKDGVYFRKLIPKEHDSPEAVLQNFVQCLGGYTLELIANTIGDIEWIISDNHYKSSKYKFVLHGYEPGRVYPVSFGFDVSKQQHYVDIEDQQREIYADGFVPKNLSSKPEAKEFLHQTMAQLKAQYTNNAPAVIGIAGLVFDPQHLKRNVIRMGSLSGLNLPVTDTTGGSPFTLLPGKSQRLPVLVGARERGWLPKIKKDGLNRFGFYEFTVQTHPGSALPGGVPQERTFEIGRFVSTYSRQGMKVRYFEIVPVNKVAVMTLSNVIAKRKKPFNAGWVNKQLNDLAGYYIPKVITDGRIRLLVRSPGDSMEWMVVGKKSAGWKVRILGSRINTVANTVLLTVLIHQVNGEYRVRTFELGKAVDTTVDGTAYYSFVPVKFSSIQEALSECAPYISNLGSALAANTWGNINFTFHDVDNADNNPDANVMMVRNGEYFKLFGYAFEHHAFDHGFKIQSQLRKIFRKAAVADFLSSTKFKDVPTNRKLGTFIEFIRQRQYLLDVNDLSEVYDALRQLQLAELNFRTIERIRMSETDYFQLIGLLDDAKTGDYVREKIYKELAPTNRLNGLRIFLRSRDEGLIDRISDLELYKLIPVDIRGQFIRPDAAMTVFQDRLNALTADQLRQALRAAHPEVDPSDDPVLKEWERVSFPDGVKKIKVAGGLILRKVNIARQWQWAVLWGKRGYNAADSKGVYIPPAGKLDDGETFPIAGRREAQEETGINLNEPLGHVRYFIGDKPNIIVRFGVYIDETKDKPVSVKKELEDFQWVPLHLFLHENKAVITAGVEQFLKSSVAKNFSQGEGFTAISQFFTKAFQPPAGPRTFFHSRQELELYLPIVYGVYAQAAGENRKNLRRSSKDINRIILGDRSPAARAFARAVSWALSFSSLKGFITTSEQFDIPKINGIYGVAMRMSKELGLPRVDILSAAYAHLVEASILVNQPAASMMPPKDLTIEQLFVDTDNIKKADHHVAMELAAFLRAYFPGSLGNQEFLLRKFLQIQNVTQETQALYLILGRLNKAARTLDDQYLSLDHDETLKNSSVYGLALAALFLAEFKLPRIALARLFQYANENKIPALIIMLPKQEKKPGSPLDWAQLAAPTGGIDLTPAQLNLQMAQASEKQAPVEFHISPQEWTQLQNAPGFKPVIVSVLPLADLHAFLGGT